MLSFALDELMKLEFKSQLFKEGEMYVAYTPELDLSSCATTKTKAQKNLIEAVRMFLEEAEKKGSLSQILEQVDLNSKLRQRL